MKMEQSIAKANPANEVRIDSFEDFDQAYDFCKAQKNVGLIMVLENSGDALAADAFKQLGTHYESKGWPCFGVLFHESQKSMMGHLSLQKNKNLLNYYSVEDIIDPHKTFGTLSEIWQSFVVAFETSLIPEKLQETLLSLSQQELSADEYGFRNRLAVLLAQNLNISWMEAIALKWEPVVSVLKESGSKALVPNAALVQIAGLAARDETAGDLLEAVRSKSSLCSRISTVTGFLEKARAENKLVDVLDRVATEARPGAPALLRQIALSKDRILAIAYSTEKTKLRVVP